MIATPSGDRAIEQFSIGDPVLTVSGAVRLVRWIGRRSYGGRFLRRNTGIWPVVIRAGALADGVPTRDLYVSPRHAMFLDGMLAAAEDLLNGVTILGAEPSERLDYLHIEFATHDVILAEGAPSESCVDDDNRAMFHNADSFAEAYDAEPVPALYCAPRVTEGYALADLRQRLAARAYRCAA